MNDRTAELDRQKPASLRFQVLERLRAEMTEGFILGKWAKASETFKNSALAYVNAEFEYHNAAVRHHNALERRIAARIQWATGSKAASILLRLGGLSVAFNLRDDWAPTDGKANGRFLYRLIPESAITGCRLRWSLPGAPGDE